MTPDDRMPNPGNPTLNAAFNNIVGVTVALFLLGSRGAMWATQAIQDWRLERAETRAQRREKARQAWDDLGCDIWSDEP